MKRVNKNVIFTVIALAMLTLLFFSRSEKRLGWYCENKCVFEENDTTFLVLQSLVDEESKPLMGDQEYLIEGVSLPAEDWSISLYVKNVPFTFDGKEQFVKKSEVKKNSYGLWQVRLSLSSQEGATLLNTGKKEPVKLVLRLKEPEPYLIRWGSIFSSPTIKKLEKNSR